MLSSSRKLLKQQINALLVVVFIAGSAFAQGPSLNLASGTAVKGGSLSLNLTLSAATSAPSGLQWTLSYPPADITSVSSVAGPALTAANKTLSCSGGGGSVTCMAMGTSAAAISSGVVAVITATVSPNASSSQDPLPLSNVMGTLMDGKMLGISGTGGVISVAQAAPPTVSSLQCSPTTLASSSTSTCTVTLTNAAPAGGATVTLSDNNTALTVPASVSVATAATSATFNATTSSIASDQSATLTATYNSSSANTTVSLVASVLVSSVVCNPTTLGSNASSTCTVTLTKAAPAGGATVTLSDNNAALTVPASVSVAAAATSATFNATTSSIASDQSATLTATYNSSSANTTVSLVASVLVSSVVCNPTTLGSNASSTCTVTLTKAAPAGGATVTLSDNNAALTVPASVSVTAAATSATFNATTSSIASDQSATLTATYNGSSANTTVSLVASVLVSSVACNPTTLGSNASSTCTVALTKAAPAGGATVTLSDNNAALTVPASVSVTAAATSATFSATTSSIASNQSATLTATYNSSSANTTVSLVASVLVSSLACNPTTLGSNASSTCTVTLTKAAPAGGATVTLSDNNAALTVPASVSVAAAATSATFSATTSSIASNQSVTLTATYNGSSANTTVSLVASVLVSSLACNPTTLGSNASSTCTVTLTKAAPAGGATVTLSDNNAALTVPASVSVAAAATSATFSATTSSIASNQSATLTATYNGSSANTTVSLVASVLVSSLVCNPTTLGSNASSTCTVTLTKAAPAGGATVTLSDNNTALTVPATVSVAAAATSATFSATTSSIASDQSATLTATYNGSSANTALSLKAATQVTGPVTGYGLDEGTGSLINDLSGNGHSATLLGNPTWKAGGKYGGGLLLNGSTSYVRSDNPALPTGNFTWMLWVNRASTSAFQTLIEAQGTTAAELEMNLENGKVSVWSSGSPRLTTTTSVPAKAWTHVALTRSGSTLRAYINGVADSKTGSDSRTFNFLSCPLLIGVDADSGCTGLLNGYLSGTVDEVRIYSRALSQAEIQTAMNAPITPAGSLQDPTSIQTAPAATAGEMTATSARLSRTPGGTDLKAPAASLPASVLSDLFCTPRVVGAGGHVSCELRVVANAHPSEVEVTSSSEQVKAPAVIRTRANQSRLTFQVDADTVARHQLVTVAATASGAVVQDTIEVMPASHPILTVPDRQVVKPGAPISFLVKAVDPTDLPMQLTVSDVPSGASFDTGSGRFDWTPGREQNGTFKVMFTATNSVRQAASTQVTIEVTSAVPSVSLVERVCSPGAISTLAGSWLAEPGSAHTDPSGKAMDLGGTRVKVNGQYVPVLMASPGQVQFLCPALDPQTQLEVAVETASGVTEPINMMMQSASPWIFSLNVIGQNQGLVSFDGTTELAMVRNSGVQAHPAQSGEEILIWGSGFGSPRELATNMISIKLGGVDAEVESLNAVPGLAGVYAIRVRVPSATVIGDAVPLQLQVIGVDGKQSSSNRVTIAVEEVSR